MRSNRIESEDEVVLEPAAGGANGRRDLAARPGSGRSRLRAHDPRSSGPARRCPRPPSLFPHAEVRPVTINAGYAMRAWYDIRELSPDGRDGRSRPGPRPGSASSATSSAAPPAGGIAARRIVLAGFLRKVAPRRCMWDCDTLPPLGGIIALSALFCRCARRLVAETGTGEIARQPVLMCHGREDCGGAANFRRAIPRCVARGRRTS